MPISELFRELHRVLRPGGRLALETVLAGPVPGVRYPTFWASSPVLSFLLEPEDMRALLAAQGLVEQTWEDATSITLEQARRRRASASTGGPPALGRDVIVVEDVARKVENSIRNAVEEHTRTLRAVLRRTA